MNTMDNNIIKGKLKLLLKDIDYRTLIIALEYNRIAYKEIANNHKDYFNRE